MIKDFVKGKTVEEKFKSINTTLKHFSRRLQKFIIGVIPSAPVFDFVMAPASDGVVMRRIFPAEGRITKGVVFVAEGKKISLVATMENVGSSASKGFQLRKGIPLAMDLDIKVNIGDRLTFSVSPESEDVRGIWIGFLYEPSVRDLGKTKFMVEQFENMIEEVVKDAGEDQES